VELLVELYICRSKISLLNVSGAAVPLLCSKCVHCIFQKYAEIAVLKTRVSIRQATALHELAILEAELRDNDNSIQSLEVSLAFNIHC